MNYLKLKDHYLKTFKRYGDTAKGMDWPNEKDALIRHKVMLDLINRDDSEISLLDFGCGTAQFYEFILSLGISRIKYTGLDISQEPLIYANKKFPNIDFIKADAIKDHDKIGQFDYVIMNGLFTEKLELKYEDMWDFFSRIIKITYSKCKIGMAFNLMSKDVDWERDDLFHVGLSNLSSFLCSEVTRNFVIRNDYGLYEFTTYLYKK